MASGDRQSNPVPALPDGSDAETLFQSHAPWLLGSLRRHYGPDLAEDLLQETYLRLKRHKTPLEILRPKAFLMQVARNLFVDGHRRDRRRAELESVAATAWPQVEAADQVETLALKEIVLRLPRPLRDVFILSRVCGLSNAAIAARLGIRVKTVEGRMTKALAHCAAQLRREP